MIVYPAHGAGSACGKSLGKETFSTIGEQKKHNYALESKTKEEFIQKVTEGISTPPQYFPINAQINKEGYESLDEVLEQGMKGFSVKDFKNLINDDIILLDTRTETDFVKGFVTGSINIGLNGRFAEWAGSLLPFDKSILLVTDPGKEKETIIRLARVGFEKIYVHCAGGYRSVIACSLLKRQGIHNLRNIAGGWNAIKEQEKVEIVKEKSVLN